MFHRSALRVCFDAERQRRKNGDLRSFSTELQHGPYGDEAPGNKEMWCVAVHTEPDEKQSTRTHAVVPSFDERDEREAEYERKEPDPNTHKAATSHGSDGLPSLRFKNAMYDLSSGEILLRAPPCAGRHLGNLLGHRTR